MSKNQHLAKYKTSYIDTLKISYDATFRIARTYIVASDNDNIYHTYFLKTIYQQLYPKII